VYLVRRVTSLFLTVLSLIYFIAFVSFGVQAEGLIGSQGVLPVANYLGAMRQAMGTRAIWYAPTVFWLSSSDCALRLVWLSGAALSIVAALGFFRRVCLILLLILYLSISAAGQDFWSFQWDILLLEAGLLTMFLDVSPLRTWLVRWLLFRLMFMSGLVKLASADPTWRNLTAMSYHYLTQPLPTPLAWYMDKLPLGFQKFTTALVLFSELLVPLLIFAPQRLRRIAGCVLISLQILILLTGNYTFFNWLTIALCLFLFPERPVRTISETWTHRAVTAALATFVLVTSGLQFLEMLSFPLPSPVAVYLGSIAPLRIINTYGLFAVMTTTRPEIIVEGSNDHITWQPYEFLYKPGPLRRPPPWVAPYQPRLDWQMWFAALGSPRQNLWFYNFAARLLQGSPSVLKLLARNPFPNGPPRYIRALLYDYHFTTFAERRATGNWWRREETGIYLAPVSLRAR
jgi:hypothetical protein